ncbi:unnamed protein product [Closterium sp. NIES-54]
MDLFPPRPLNPPSGIVRVLHLVLHLLFLIPLALVLTLLLFPVLTPWLFVLVLPLSLSPLLFPYLARLLILTLSTLRLTLPVLLVPPSPVSCPLSLLTLQLNLPLSQLWLLLSLNLPLLTTLMVLSDWSFAVLSFRLESTSWTFWQPPPHLYAMRLEPEGDPDAPDIPTPLSYLEAITSPCASQWMTAMNIEMVSWKSTGTYVDEIRPPGANIVSDMWMFKVKRPPVSPPAFKARYVARGFSHHEGVDIFQTFFPTPKMTTLRVLLHVAAQRDYELHSLDFLTTFLSGHLHEQIWLRHRPCFSGSFLLVPNGTSDDQSTVCARHLMSGTTF